MDLGLSEVLAHASNIYILILQSHTLCVQDRMIEYCMYQANMKHGFFHPHQQRQPNNWIYSANVINREVTRDGGNVG